MSSFKLDTSVFPFSALQNHIAALTNGKGTEVGVLQGNPQLFKPFQALRSIPAQKTCAAGRPGDIQETLHMVVGLQFRTQGVHALHHSQWGRRDCDFLTQGIGVAVVGAVVYGFTPGEGREYVGKKAFRVYIAARLSQPLGSLALRGQVEVIHMKQALMSDAISTAAGAMVGTSTVTTVVESSAGIAAGGRTGLTSLVTAVMFLAAIIFVPVVSIIPAAATAPALIFVGILMLGNIRDVDFSDMSNALPAFCTIVFMPFTYSIANGVAFGLITYCLMKLTTGRKQDVKVLTLMISAVFIVRYAFMTLG